MPDEDKFINVYLVDQAYGGPEEGGWWYDIGEPAFSVPLNPGLNAFIGTAEVIDRLNIKKYLASFQPGTFGLDEAKRWCDEQNAGRPSMHSVLSEGEYRVYSEKHTPEPWPDVKPHYE